ncbi:MAG: T9SS type A sorting domain-containing protein [Muribaculaceae bacterium]|nr:T9SS type A sorting domain-containing protein [Muribaculaceae bacterium]
MKKKRIISVGWLAGLILSCFCPAKAQESAPCLIFTGNSDSHYNIDLSRLNRITFGEEGMTISSSTDSDTPEVILLYTLYNHFTIADAIPTDASGVDEVKADGNVQLRFISNAKSLALESSSSSAYTIGIFSINGTLIATSSMTAGQSLSLDALTPGTYIAVATNGESQISIKFKL